MKLTSSILLAPKAQKVTAGEVKIAPKVPLDIYDKAITMVRFIRLGKRKRGGQKNLTPKIPFLGRFKRDIRKKFEHRKMFRTP